jgi:hypothetical protein
MLARRGFRATFAAPDLPIPPGASAAVEDGLAALCGHYAFRLFLRGAIQHPAGFAPEQATRYLSAEQAERFSEQLTALGLAQRVPGGAYRLVHPPRSFGGTLEWYVARELARWGGFDVAAGVNFHAVGIGGDLDVIAAAEGKLVYLELKSSPPKHLTAQEVGAFFDRLGALRPDVALFVVDTALRLSDRVLPALESERARRAERRGIPFVAAQRLAERQVWALTPHVFAVNAKPDLSANVARAVAAGIHALAPEPP